jgi:hypothetical protein
MEGKTEHRPAVYFYVQQEADYGEFWEKSIQGIRIYNSAILKAK